MSNELLAANETLQQFRHLTTPAAQTRPMPELRLLWRLSLHDHPTPSIIADEWHVSRAAITKAIAPLVQDQLVEKLVNQEDKRSFGLGLTAAGQVLAADQKSTYLGAVSSLKASLGPSQFTALITLLESANVALTVADQTLDDARSPRSRHDGADLG